MKAKTIKIRCRNCNKKIKVLMELGESFRYPTAGGDCPYCGYYFGIIKFLIK